MNSEIQTTHTACWDCIFAKWQKSDDKCTQVGCHLGLTDIYKKHGILVEAYDKKLEFYIVNGRKCKGKQSRELDKLESPVEIENADFFSEEHLSRITALPQDEQVRLMKKWIKTQIDVIVLCDKNTSEEDLIRTLNSLKNQSPKVVYITNTDCPVKDYARFTLMVKKNVGDLTWQVVFPQSIEDVPAYEGFAVDEIVRKMNQQEKHVLTYRTFESKLKNRTDYYVVMRPGQELCQDFLENVDKRVNEYLENILLIEGECPVVNVKAHQNPFLQGNVPFNVGTEEEPVILSNIYEKLRHFSQEQGHPEYITCW